MKSETPANPFEYPEGVHIRRHGPKDWKDYARYRPWLRDEFCFRCVYCLIREPWVDMRRGYQIDHFQPQAIRPDLKSDFDNLLYLCPSCNNLKGSQLLPDPCVIPLDSCLKFLPDGSVKSLNRDGDLLIEVLELDDPRLENFRRGKTEDVKTLFEYNQPRYFEVMGFPEDLPDLAAENCRKNSRPDGVQESWFAKREAGCLPLAF